MTKRVILNMKVLVFVELGHMQYCSEHTKVAALEPCTKTKVCRPFTSYIHYTFLVAD